MAKSKRRISFRIGSSQALGWEADLVRVWTPLTVSDVGSLTKEFIGLEPPNATGVVKRGTCLESILIWKEWLHSNKLNHAVWLNQQ